MAKRTTKQPDPRPGQQMLKSAISLAFSANEVHLERYDLLRSAVKSAMYHDRGGGTIAQFNSMQTRFEAVAKSGIFTDKELTAMGWHGFRGNPPRRFQTIRRVGKDTKPAKPRRTR